MLDVFIGFLLKRNDVRLLGDIHVALAQLGLHDCTCYRLERKDHATGTYRNTRRIKTSMMRGLCYYKY